MRYSESRDRSEELLKLALSLMGRQSAAFHPVSYSVWYEHVGGLNESLSCVLRERLEAKRPLSEDDVRSLYERYIAARDIEAFDRIEQLLRAQLEEAARSATHAGTDVAQFNNALENHRSELSRPDAGAGIHAIVNALIRDTHRMQVATVELAKRMEASLSEVQRLQEELRRAHSDAAIDMLTGLRNRRGLEESAAQLAQLHGGLDGSALLMADIDHFKVINDRFGHLLGDKVLSAIGQLLRSTVKGKDIAARFGGEEFVVLLPATTCAGATALAQQIRVGVAEGRIRSTGGPSIGTVTMSIGVAAARSSDDLQSLIARADAALYEAKKAGRNRVWVAPESSSEAG